MKVKRNDRSEVVDLIIDDLNHAVENLPAFKELTTEEEGRISKEGAQAFLSKWLFMKEHGRSRVMVIRIRNVPLICWT